MAAGLRDKALRYRIFHAVLVVLLIVIDQVSKFLVRENLADKDVIVLKGVFRFTFVKNTGAAWGIFSRISNSAVFLSILSILILAFVLFLYFRIPNEGKYAPLQVLLVLIVSGAIGNLIDRFMLKYVTDFLFFELINFPVFNIADCYITVACFLLLILILTKYRNDELEFLSFKKKDK
jgi:signal peptidase II